MSITDAMRKVFDECTVMAGVEPDFECVYITKDAALLYLNEIDADNAKLRELCKKLYRLADESYVPFRYANLWMNEFDNAIRAMRELGIEV